MKKFLYSKKAAPYVFILPFVLTFAVFWVIPLAKSGVMSMEKILPGQTEFIGAVNFKRLFSDRVFKVAVINSFKYMLFTLLLLIPIPMLMACMVNSKLVTGKIKGFFKSSLFIPALTSVVVAGTIFRLIFGEMDTALMNRFIGVFDFEPIKWLKGAATGFAALLSLACWRWFGVNMMYFLSGLQSIPEDYYEAASIDGASTWQKFIKITVPQLKPTIIYVLTISIYGGLAMFTESYMLWQGNNSPQNIGLTIVGYLYRQGIEKNDMGYASAVGVVLLVIVLVVNIIQLMATGMFKKEKK
ncbi:carbohydrate ABC transporter permease [Novisyntrophococcus fermenticellae]|uniref:carbohydrate ABC transporter permease n=1 Tax=Novisyntrophococcus fermenticellae TaxID=2068655 RepID=UPI001E54FC38|nr:sugar ABC transporter permease [Novisyntrophococcus fermenticellae]